MSLSSEYARQHAWRDWPTVINALPSLDGRLIFDLGCAAGDLPSEFVARGARVIGFDANEELLSHARARHLKNAEFRTADLRSFPDPGLVADGIWSSFAAAFFPNFAPVLAIWARYQKPGGWIALTEVDDLFGHQPLSDRSAALFSAYAREALAAGRYDFHMGRKLKTFLEQCGFHVEKVLTLADHELAFRGSARPDVLDGWRARFERLNSLRTFCGAEFEEVREEFLACLAREDHWSTAKVNCCIATRIKGH